MCVYQKWHDKIFPMVNFVFYHDGPFGLGGWHEAMVLSCRPLAAPLVWGPGGPGGGGYPHLLWFTAILLLPPWGGDSWPSWES